MADIARLGFVVDTRNLFKAVSELRRLVEEAGRAEGAAAKTGNAWSMALGKVRGIALGVGGAIAAALTTGKFVEAADQYTVMNNSLMAMGQSAQYASENVDRIAQIARDTRSPLESLVRVYQRVNILSGEMGLSQDRILKFTKNVALALAQQGGSARQASGALLQMTQALSSGVVRAEEFNSMMEGAYPVLAAAAKGIKEAGGSVARLRAIMLDGRLTSKAFFEAVESQSKSLIESFGRTQATVGQAMQVLGDTFIISAGKIDRAFGITKRTAQGILSVAGYLNQATTWIVNNSNAIVGALGALATILVFRIIPAIAQFSAGLLIGAANALRMTAATLTLSTALVALRTALIRTGLGAIAVLVGYAIAKFLDLADAVGGIGEAFVKVGELFNLVWEAIKDSTPAIIPAFQMAFHTIESAFAKMLGHMLTDFYIFLVAIGKAFAEVSPGPNKFGMAAEAIGEAADRAYDLSADASKRAADAGARAGAVLDHAWGPVLGKLKSFQNLIDANRKKVEAATPPAVKLGGAMDDLTKGKKGGKGKREKELKDVVGELQKELQKLTIEYTLGATAAEIWSKQQEAGVSPLSAQGQAIAQLVPQIELLKERIKQVKDSTESFKRGVQSIAEGTTSLFRAAIKGSDDLRSAIGNLAGQLGELLLNRAFLSILGMMGGKNQNSWLGSVIGWFNKTPGAANGMYTGSGPKMGGVDGKGGRLIRVHPKEHILNEGQMNRLGGSQDVNVTVSVDNNGNLQAFVNRQVAGGIQHYDKRLPQRVMGINRDPKKRVS